MLKWVRRMWLPLHHLILLLKKDPFSSSSSSNSAHSILIVIVVFHRRPRLFKDLSIVIWTKSSVKGSKVWKACTWKVQNLGNNISHIVREKPEVILLRLGLRSGHRSFVLASHIRYVVIIGLY